MRSDRINLEMNGIRLNAFYLGNDLIVTIRGGEEHLGAVAVGVCYGAEKNKSNASVISLPGHKEDSLVFPIAARLSKTLKTNVCVIAGIHFEKPTPDQISDIIQNTRQLIDRLIERLQTE